MTKEYFIELADYHIWANKTVCNWLENLSAEQWEQPVVSSFNSLHETILHTAGAEKIWIERFKKQSKFELLTQTFNGTNEDLIKLWKKISRSLQEFIEQMPDNLLQQKLSFKNMKGIEHNVPYYQLLAHVINHSTYHRGQVVTMLRQVGFTDLSSIDMTTFFRIRNELPEQVVLTESA